MQDMPFAYPALTCVGSEIHSVASGDCKDTLLLQRWDLEVDV